jgi:hypothetical protein
VAAKFSKPFVVSLKELLAIRLSGIAAKSLVMSNHMQHQHSLRQADITTGEATSHLTRLSKYDNPVAGYQGERSNGFSE